MFVSVFERRKSCDRARLSSSLFVVSLRREKKKKRKPENIHMQQESTHCYRIGACGRESVSSYNLALFLLIIFSPSFNPGTTALSFHRWTSPLRYESLRTFLLDNIGLNCFLFILTLLQYDVALEPRPSFCHFLLLARGHAILEALMELYRAINFLLLLAKKFLLLFYANRKIISPSSISKAASWQLHAMRTI